MDQLIVCSACRHGALYHEGDGCSRFGCACKETSQDVVHEQMRLAIIEPQRRRRPLRTDGAGSESLA